MVETAYDPQTFIDIYQGGQNALSNWRRNHPNDWMDDKQEWANALDFSDVNFAKFSDDERIRFNRWDFGSGAKFAKASFAGCQVYFEQCTFGEGVDFNGVEFGTSAIFDMCIFYGKIAFVGHKFENLYLHQCTFNGGNRSQGIIFANCEFNGDTTRFDSSQFSENCEKIVFNDCRFNSQRTDFVRVSFNSKCEFSNCRFQFETDFNNANFYPASSFSNCDFGGNLAIYGSSDSRLPSFLSCEFSETMNYSGRSLNADFAGSIFHELPSFSSQDKDIDKLNLTDVKFKIVNRRKNKSPFDFTTDRSKLLALRTLRGAAEKTKNHDLERDLYIEERKAERGIFLREYCSKIGKGNWFSRIYNIGRIIGHCLMIAIMWAYWLSSNYGRNVIWPPVWLGFFLLGNISNYRLTFNEVAIHGIQYGTLDGALEIGKYNNLVDTLAIANSVPIIGNLSLDNEMEQFVFCGGNLPADASVCIPPDGYFMMLISQNLIAGILIFLFGLGLRNYFKIK